MIENTIAARFGPLGDAVVIEGLTTSNADVVHEAKRWTTGRRGALVEEPAHLAEADLTTFVEETVVIGARALAATAQTAEARAVEQMLKDVGTRTADASRQAAEATGRATREASETLSRVAVDARKAITEADRQNREELTSAVGNAKQEMAAEMRRLFGGENPELLAHLQPMLHRFGTTVEKTMRTSAMELLEKATKQLDPADPTSPLAKHAAALTEQQEVFARRVETRHTELTSKFDELVTALRVQEAKATLAKVTPIKGGSFEEQIHALMHGVAAGIGDEYRDTACSVGLVPRSKKGDGVLIVGSDDTCVVVEMTDSSRTGWGDYFDEAERNRGAAASLGIVRRPAQNGGQTIRVLGVRRVVLAFDPDGDDPELLRTIVLLLRTVALAASARSGGAEIATAEERIGEAVVQLEKLDAIKKLAGGVQKGATKIDSECTAIATSIQRLLDQALAALGGTSAIAERASVGVETNAGVA